MRPVAEQLAPVFPDGWGTTQLRYASTCLDGRRVPLNVEQRSRRQGEYPYWGANGVVDSINEYLFDEPLVLIGEDGAPFFDSNRPVAFFVTGKIWVNNHIHVLKIGRNFDSRFVTHCLNVTDYGPHIEGSTRDKLTQEKMGSIRLPSPPLPQQRAIADYLDRETAQLDALVAAKERVLGLLAEKRRAIITRAVTRGLDTHAPLRNSGIPWLGEIPAHWEVKRLKFVSTEPLAYGANEAALDDDHSFPRFVRITDINEKGNLIDETYRSLEPKIAEPYLLNDGDILFARSGATVGKAFLYKESWGPSCFAGYLIRLRCNKQLVRPDFIFAYTQSDPYWGQLREGTIQATIQNFSAEKYGQLFLTLPPLWEQSEIMDQLSRSLSDLDTLRSSAESTIALLRERRGALIAAAVTGQIEVKADA